MKKLNLDIIFKILILLSFSIFYFKLILSNEILIYVHPRIIPFAIFGLISMFLIALFLTKDIFHSKKKKFKIKNYAAFIIPLIFVFFIQSITANSVSNYSDSNTNDDKILPSANSSYEIYGGKTESDGQGNIDKKELDIKDNVIQITSNNFVFSLDEILDNPDKYDGKEIEISGFVYRDKDLGKNEFIVGRFLMICCAADMQIAGITCDNNNIKAYPNDTWVKIKGKIKKNTADSSDELIIVVEHIEKDPNPNTSYVYPY